MASVSGDIDSGDNIQGSPKADSCGAPRAVDCPQSHIEYQLYRETTEDQMDG